MSARFTPLFVLAGAVMIAPVACATNEEPHPAGPVDPDPRPLSDAGADAADAPAPPDAGGPTNCSKGGFCYVTVPVGKSLSAVSASSRDDAWMATYVQGGLLHWDGKALSQVYEYAGTVPRAIAFMYVWAEKKDDVWAVGYDENLKIVIVRYAPPLGGGAPAFRVLPTNHPLDVEYRDGKNIWVAPAADALWIANGTSNTDGAVLRIREEESGTTIERFKPTASTDDTRTYRWNAVWGFGPSDVYAAGAEIASEKGAIAHFDGTAWSLTILETGELASLHGTAPGQPRQLWYHVDRKQSSDPIRSFLAPIAEGGAPGTPIFTNELKTAGCSSRIGQAVTPTSGWFSDGLLVCQWNGTSLQPVTTALPNGALIDQVRAIWTGSAGDTWIVGQAKPKSPGFPSTGFATYRTASGSQP